MWEAGEPNNYGSKENCIVANYRQHSQKWNGASCDTKFHFVCQSMPKGSKFQLVYWFNEFNYILGFLGCYEDSYERKLPFAHIRSSSMTVEMCVEHCMKQNYPYAGVQHYDECFCGNELPPTQKPLFECSAPCKGNSAQTCGGSWRNSVFLSGTFNWILKH